MHHPTLVLSLPSSRREQLSMVHDKSTGKQNKWITLKLQLDIHQLVTLEKMYSIRNTVAFRRKKINTTDAASTRSFRNIARRALHNPEISLVQLHTN